MYEIAACFPSSGGQYHFIFILAPERYKRVAAFAVGWMNLLGWSVALCAAISVVVKSLEGVVVFWRPEGGGLGQVEWYGVYVGVGVLSGESVLMASYPRHAGRD